MTLGVRPEAIWPAQSGVAAEVVDVEPTGVDTLILCRFGAVQVTASVRERFRAPPGFGDTNWTDVVSELRLGGYEGSIDIEGWHDPVYRDDLEMTGQVHALSYLKQCRGGPFVANP